MEPDDEELYFDSGMGYVWEIEEVSSSSDEEIEKASSPSDEDVSTRGGGRLLPLTNEDIIDLDRNDKEIPRRIRVISGIVQLHAMRLRYILNMIGIALTVTIVPFILAFKDFDSCPHFLQTVDMWVSAFFCVQALLKFWYSVWRVNYIAAPVAMIRERVAMFGWCLFSGVYETSHVLLHYFIYGDPLFLHLICIALKFLRLSHLWSFREWYPSERRNRDLFFFVELLRLVTVVLVLVHVGGCVFFFLNEFTEKASETWIGNGSGDDAYKQKGIWFCYVRSIYWSSATVTTTGYGDYHAQTSPEMLFSYFWMLVSCGWWNDFRALYVAWRAAHRE